MKVRELTRDEIAAIPNVITPVPDSMFAMGVENERGEIVASLPVFLSVHADPLWVREDYGRPTEDVLLKIMGFVGADELQARFFQITIDG